MHVLNSSVLCRANRYLQFEIGMFTSGDRTLSSTWLKSTDIVYSVDNLSGDDVVAFSAWFKALFDSNSEGIEDSILRYCHHLVPISYHSK